jgi:signal transduction histidine kinase
VVTEVLEFPLPAAERPVRAGGGAEAYAGGGRPASDALVHQLGEALLTGAALLGADAGVVSVRLPDGRMHLAASAGLHADELTALRGRPPGGTTADGAGDGAEDALFLARRVLPITTPGGEHWGAMVLYFRHAGRPGASRLRLAESFVHQLGWAVERDRRAAAMEGDVRPAGSAQGDVPPEEAAATAAPPRAGAAEPMRTATDRVLALQALSDTLARATSSAEMLRLTAEHCRTAAGARLALVVQQLADRDTLDVAAAAGDPDGGEDWRGVPAGAVLPSVEAVRTERPVLVASPDELAARFPALEGWARRAGVRALAALPVLVAGEPAAALVLGFDTARRFGGDEREFLLGLARIAARALERLHLAHAARAATEAKSDFLAMMSHELRTPLNAIMGYTGLLADEVVGPLNGTQREQLRRVQEQAQHLLGLIEEVLTLSRAESAGERLHVDTVEPGALLRDVVAVLAPAARRKGLALRAEVDDAVQPAALDADKVRQVLAHLLTNAVKFTAAGEVVAGVREERASTVPALVFSVRDTGSGIAPDHLAHIFEPFWQAESKHARRVGGTGLGLNVTRRLADLLGGEVHVASTPGIGSTFELWLPLAARG